MSITDFLIEPKSFSSGDTVEVRLRVLRPGNVRVTIQGGNAVFIGSGASFDLSVEDGTNSTRRVILGKSGVHTVRVRLTDESAYLDRKITIE